MDRRRFLRIHVDLPGTVRLASGMELPVRVFDVSGGGLQIHCDALDSEIIAPGGDCLDRHGRPIEVDVCFQPESRPLQLHCRIVFVRRLSRDRYCIGLSYADPLQSDVIEVERVLLSTATRPSTPP
ncbi:PilZ domain-containing protein [Methylomarinovum caldicuralii]|nr:PilZ domain-containing protein [Methylomarinovum caldicuralii]